MKTLTEFSGMIIRLAAKGLADAKAALPAEAPPNEVPTEGAPAAPAADGEATKAAFDAAISKESGVKGDRLERLREALEAVGDKVADVRLVRVFAGEEAVPGAKKIGAHHYVVDILPQSMKQVSTRPERKERGDRDRGPKRAEGSLSAPFSMDSIKEDRGGGGPRRGPGAPKPGGNKGP